MYIVQTLDILSSLELSRWDLLFLPTEGLGLDDRQSSGLLAGRKHHRRAPRSREIGSRVPQELEKTLESCDLCASEHD